MTEIYVSTDIEADGPIPGPRARWLGLSARDVLMHGVGSLRHSSLQPEL